MCLPGTAGRGRPRSGELAWTRPEAPAQRQVRSQRPDFGTLTTPPSRSFVPARELRTSHSTPHERLQTGQPARANLPGETRSPLGPIAAPPLSGARDTPTSELPGVQTLPGLPILLDVGPFRFPLPRGRTSEK